MNTTPIKILENITTQFSKFNTNQVLTEAQLNEFLDYFKDQDHLTRIGLSGVGNVCGFKIELEDDKIKITHGFGVTTDGDLITLPKIIINLEEEERFQTLETLNTIKAFETYRHYREFNDDKAIYSKFLRNGEQIQLYELIPENLANELDPIPNLISNISDLNDKVVLLYLENYEKEPESCDKMGCNNQGLEQVARLKVLLVSQNDANYLAENDAIFSRHNLYELHKNLPEVNARRIILTSNNTGQLNTIKQQFSKAITLNESLNELIEGYRIIYTKFGFPQIDTLLFQLLNLPSPTSDFQYRYDLFKDLIATYNDIKDLLLHINVECCPNIGAFPKHLLLGKLIEKEKFKTLRHQFYKSPIIGHEDANYKKVLLLIDRATQLVENYEITDGIIKITPSNELTPLSHKAIPFYYNVEDKLLNSWSYKKTSNFSQDTNLSYHVEKLKQVDIIQNPLKYNIDQNDFYRIEGHQGKMYRDALDSILTLKEEFGLNFDVKVLPINVTSQSINIDDYQCEFEELSMLLNAWRTEQNCILSEMSRFFSGFKTDDVGSNLVAVNAGYQQDFTVVEDQTTTGTTATAATTGTVGTNIGNITIENSIEALEARLRLIQSNNLNLEANTSGFNNSNKLRGNNQFLNNKVKADNSELIYNLENNINVVEEGLTIDENTIGRHLNDAILENKKGSANDIYTSFRDRTAIIRDQEVWIAEPELTEFIFNDIAIALIHSYVLDDRIPNLILDIDQSTINNYKLTIDELCDRVKVLQARYQSRRLKNGTKEILGLVINQLATVCCSGKKLEILLAEIERRKQKILTQLQLSEFVKKHPGLEHKAGVVPGGTFVMAYLFDNAIDQSTYETVRMELNFLEQPNIDDNGTDGDEGRIILWNERVSTNFAFLHKVTSETQNPAGEIVIIGNTIEETVANLVAFLNRIWRRAGALKYCTASSNGRKLIIEIKDRLVERNKNFILFFNPEIVGTNNKIYFSPNEIITGNITNRNIVVADFSLPYMCCSDCTPVNFIIPKEPTFLSLPDAFICLTEELLPIPFTVSPIDGEVKATVNLGINGGVVNVDNNYYFDAQIIDESLYGQEISFTVNDEVTDCKITVYKKPDILIGVSITYNEAKTQATVRFNVTGNLTNEVSYLWNLGNGIELNQAPNSEGVFTYIYDLPANEENIVIPTLTLSNGNCSNEYEMETIEFDDPIDVNLVIVDSICVDTQSDEVISIPFTNINPINGDIQLVQQDITGIEVLENTLVITPNTFNTFESEFTFTINEILTTASTTIYEKTIVSIENRAGNYRFVDDILYQEYEFNAVIPDGINTNGFVFTWLIDGVAVGVAQTLTHYFELNPEENTFNIELKVTNLNGCITEVELIPFLIDYPEIELKIEENDIKDFCIEDNNQYNIIVEPTIEGIVINSLGVTLNDNGDNVFTPNTTGLEVEEDTLSVQTILSVLTHELFITLHHAKVSFTIDETVVNKITLQSTSLGQIESYVWIVNGVEINDNDDENEGVHEIILNENSPRNWTFQLGIQSQFCGRKISETQTSDMAFVPETVNLVIEESSKCIGRDEEGTIRVNFTTIEPNGPITINEPIPEGLSIVNNQLVIDVANFTAFNQRIDFSLNGVQSTANITLHQPSIIEIGEDQGTTFFWEGSVLKKNLIIDAIFPASVNENTSVFIWKINNRVVVSNTKTLNENVTVFGNGNTYRIDLSIQEQDACNSDAPIKSIPVNYPDFEIRIGNGIEEFCADDDTPYAINVIPDIPGTVVDISGVTVETFTPSEAGLTSGGTVNFNIAGNIELSVNLLEAPHAAFEPTYDVELNQINLTNNSTGTINRYKWFINGEAQTEGIVENDYVINITENDPRIWNFRLVAESLLCESSEAEHLDFSIENRCTTDTKIELDEVRESLIEGEIEGGDNNLVAVPTIRIYDTVLPDFIRFSNGEFNRNLTSLFALNDDNGPNNIFEITKEAIIKKASDEIEKELLIKYYNAQIRLFFSILKCQDLNTLGENRTIVESIIEAIKLSLSDLNERNIHDNNNLITYLTEYASVNKIVFIKNIILNELLPLLTK